MGDFVLLYSISTLFNLPFLGQMYPLLGKALLRVVLFYAYGLYNFVAWMFTFIEKREELAHHENGKNVIRTQERSAYEVQHDR